MQPDTVDVDENCSFGVAVRWPSLPNVTCVSGVPLVSATVMFDATVQTLILLPAPSRSRQPVDHAASVDGPAFSVTVSLGRLMASLRAYCSADNMSNAAVFTP